MKLLEHGSAWCLKYVGVYICKKRKQKSKKPLTIQIPCATIYEHLGVAQLVARYLGVVEAASSSLVTQTKHDQAERLGRVFSL